MLTDDALAAYDLREDELGSEIMRYLERQILLQIIDHRWREHLYEMDYLREGIHLRGFAQIDPLVAYKNEGYSMFQELMDSIWEEFARIIFHVEVNVEPAQAQEMFGGAEETPADVAYSGGGQEQPSAIGEARAQAAAAGATAAGAGAAGATAAAPPQQATGNGDGAAPATPTGTHRDATTGAVVKDEHAKLGRNDPCWCGSGKKYKKCHGA
jgi:preprotein translocase subunit SecA